MKRILIVLIALVCHFGSFAQTKVDLSSPNATIYTHIYFLMPENYDLAKSATTIRGVSKEEAQIKAKKIKEILDGNGLLIDFDELPMDTDYVDTVGFGTHTLEQNRNRYAPFPVRMPEIYVEKVGSKWYYSEETIKLVDELYKDTFPLEFTALDSKFPKFFKAKAFGMFIWKPVAFLLTLLACGLLFWLLMPIIMFILRWFQKKFFTKTPSEQNNKILRQLARPIVFIILLRIFLMLLPSFQLAEWNALLVTGFKIAETVFWIVVVLKLVRIFMDAYYQRRDDRRSQLDKQLAPILRKTIQGLIIFIGFLHMLTVFGVDPATVLTGASIGGIAVAFAAQDSVKNLIGTMVIFLDKPFQLDDWVAIGTVEGSVESVGFRSTRIRAADTTLHQIPNSKISESDINNKGLRIFRRYSTELGIRYDTPPELIQAFVDGIKEIVRVHPSTKSQSYNVEFISFGSSSLNIYVNVYFKDLDWGQEQGAKHIFHMGIVRLAAKLGVEFAFPSTTMMIEQLPGKESLAPIYTVDKNEIENILKEAKSDFEERNHFIDPHGSTLPGG